MISPAKLTTGKHYWASFKLGYTFTCLLQAGMLLSAWFPCSLRGNPHGMHSRAKSVGTRKLKPPKVLTAFTLK